MAKRLRKIPRNPRAKSKRLQSQGQDRVRILIVCEDERTEPAYFRKIIRNYQLDPANINIIGTGQDPNNVVKRAKIEIREAKRIDDAYTHVFCVFDRNGHATFATASSTIQDNKNLTAARSWPCFEYWLLLHFDYVRPPFDKTGNKSSCDMCIKELKKHIPDYEKNYKDFVVLMNRLDIAIKHGKKSRSDAQKEGSNNPSTEIQGVIECLKTLNIKNPSAS